MPTPPPLPPAVLASLVAAVIASLGLIVVLTRAGWATRNSGYFTAFAAGVLVTTAMTLFPEAIGATSLAPFAALAGYLTLYGLNLGFKRSAGAMLAPVVAIGAHSFLDGVEYGVLFEHDAHVGMVASVGLVAHEFAEGIILFTVLRGAGARVGLATFAAFLGAAVTTPLGAVASQPILAALSPAEMGLVLGGAAGALLYVGATHLPTHLAREGRTSLAAVYLLGVALSLSLAALHLGSHETPTEPQETARRQG